jgi:hypothetical protein
VQALAILLLAIAVAPRLGGDADRDGIIDGAIAPREVENGEPVGPDGEPLPDHLIVSIGDSVASGEGNPDAGAGLLRGAKWLERACHRSMLSGHAQAALAIERGEPTSRVTFVPLGCSGATVPRGLLGPYAGIEPRGGRELAPQVEELEAVAERREVDAALVSIGANDVGFSKVVQFCAVVSDCPRKRFDPEKPRSQAKDPAAPSLDAFVADALRRLAERYDELEAALPSALDRDRVLIVEYFDPTLGPDDFCRMFTTPVRDGLVTREESEWAHSQVLGPLNETLRAAAERHGWRAIDGVAEAFRGQGICARRPERWVRTLGESLSRQDGIAFGARLAGTLHPNEAGHRATARLIRPALAEVVGAELDDAAAEGDDDAGEGGGTWIWLALAGGIAVAVSAAIAIRRYRAPSGA